MNSANEYAIEIKLGKGRSEIVRVFARNNREMFTNLRRLYPRAAFHVLALRPAPAWLRRLS